MTDSGGLSGGEMEQARLWDALIPPLARGALGDPARPLPRVELIDGAVLHADLSGFTRLTERISQRSSEGAEEVKGIIDRCFEPLVAAVEHFGGEIARFPGDGLMAVFRSESPENSATAIQAATASGLAAVAAVDEVARELGDGPRLRVGIAHGPLWAAALGGVEGRVEVVLGGEPIEASARAARRAEPGSLVATAGTFGQLGTTCRNEFLGNGAYRIDELDVSAELVKPRIAATGDGQDENARAFLPRSLRARLEATPAQWLAEFRPATVLFVGINAPMVDPESAASLHRWFCLVQRAVYDSGGSVNQLLVDAGRAVVLVGVGTSLNQHEDDTARAVEAALEIEQALEGAGVDVSIGISSGRVYTGLRGGDAYRDYALIGPPLNRAARLMNAAPKGIRCDEQTRLGARRRFAFRALEPIAVRGFEQPLPVFAPGRRTEGDVLGRPTMLGRRAELSALRELLESFAASGSSACAVIEGEAGIGKTRLLSEFLDSTRATAVRVLMAESQALGAQAYASFRPAIERALGIDALEERDRRRAEVERRVEGLPGSHHPAHLDPLLELGMDVPEAVRSLDEAVRARQTRDLLVEVLRAWSGEDAVVVVLEDAHWLDSASWSLVEALSGRLPRVLVMIVTRPLAPEHRPPELERFLENEATLRVALESLPADEAAVLACRRLDVDELPEAARALIVEKAAGNPLFTEELVRALADKGLLEVESGVCQLRCDPSELATIELPETVHGLVNGRIDELAPDEQLTLKVASVLGDRFELEGLSALHPLHDDVTTFRHQLEAMTNIDLLRRGEDSDEYVFKHGIIAEAAYQLLSYAQRRELHERAARWLESQAANDSIDLAAVAHHWAESGVASEALPALENAGELAMGAGAHREASRFFTRALELAESADDSERARWLRRLGESQLALGKLPTAAEHFEGAAALLEPMPSGTLALARSFVREVLRQIGHRLRPGGPGLLPDAEQPLAREVASALYSLTAIRFADEVVLPHVWAAFRSLNLAERLPPSLERVNGYVAVHTLALGIGLPRIARGYERRAAQIASGLGDPRALAETSFGTGVAHLAVGRVLEARNELRLARQLYDNYRGSNRMLESIGADAYAAFCAGDYPSAIELYRNLETELASEHNPRLMAWSLGWQAAAALRTGRSSDAVALAQVAVPHAEAAGDLAAEIGCLGWLALARLRDGDLDLARSVADRARARIATLTGPGAPYVIDGLSAVIQTYLELPDHRGEERSEALAHAAEVSKTLSRLTTLLRLGRAGAALAKGRIEAARGEDRRAQRSLVRAAKLAKRAGLPYEEALASLELARIDPGANGRAALDRARQVFGWLDAHPESELCEVELARRRDA